MDDFKKDTINQEIEHMMKWADEVTSNRMPDREKLEFRDDGVYLTVYPPQKGGEIIDPELLLQEIANRNIRNIEFTKVRQAAREMKGEPVYIAPAQKEERIDGSVKVELSKNKMEAYLTVYPPRGGAPLTRGAIENALKEMNVVYGVKAEVIERALHMRQAGEALTVAQGSSPVDGKNAGIEYKFNTDVMRGKPTQTKDGRADFYNLNLVENIEPGQVLAVKIPATRGTPGYTVTGEEIPAKPGKDILIPIGKNVELRDDGNSVVSTVKGHVSILGNKISVSTVYEVNGDVYFNTGNIEFNGSVVVKGSIREGFRVTAQGDVEVMNTISDGIVECTGSLKVKNGILGKKSQIKAGGNVLTRFIENSVVASGGEVVVGEAIMHSRVSAVKSVVVGGKGVIVGGLVRAGEEISCKIAGSPLATVTELEAGIKPELRMELSRLVRERQVKEADYEKAEKAVKLLNYLQQTQGELPPDKMAILVRVSKVQTQLAEDLEQLDESISSIAQQIEQTQRGRILVQGVIHSGVRVVIGSAFMHIQDDYTFACLKKVGEDIRISSYS